MRQFFLFSMMCLMTIAAKAQVMTAANVIYSYESIANAVNSDFAYNADYDGKGNICTLYVYKKESRQHGQVELKPVNLYQYEYDDNGILTCRTKHTWTEGDWQCMERLNYKLTGSLYSVEHSKWDRKRGAFGEPSSKMVYALTPDNSVIHVSCYQRQPHSGFYTLAWQMPVLGTSYDEIHALHF